MGCAVKDSAGAKATAGNLFRGKGVGRLVRARSCQACLFVNVVVNAPEIVCRRFRQVQAPDKEEQPEENYGPAGNLRADYRYHHERNYGCAIDFSA